MGLEMLENIIHGSTSFTEPGDYTFTVPAFITRLLVFACGGGGGCGNEGSGFMGGGGGGGGGILYANVTPGQIIPITIGAGGASPDSSTVGAGENGEATTILGFTFGGGVGGGEDTGGSGGSVTGSGASVTMSNVSTGGSGMYEQAGTGYPAPNSGWCLLAGTGPSEGPAGGFTGGASPLAVQGSGYGLGSQSVGLPGVQGAVYLYW